jgi:hypothetical protein
MADDVVRTVTIKSTTEGVDQSRAALKGLAADHDGLAAVSEKVLRATERVSGQYEALQRRLDPAHRATAQLAKDHETLDKALAQGLVTQDRYNQLLATATVNSEKLGGATRQASGFQAAFQQATSGVSAQLTALSAGAGPVGTFLAGLGPWGFAAAAGLGAVSSIFTSLSEGAARFGDKQIEVRKFGEATGLTAAQIKTLTQEGSRLGISSEQVAGAVEKFTTQLDEAHQKSGELYEKVRAISPALADELAATRSTAAGLEVYTRALKAAGDESQRAAAARAGLGRGNLEVVPVLTSVGDNGGLAARAAELEKTTGITDRAVAATARLRGENLALEKQLQGMKDSAFAEIMLELRNRQLKIEVSITQELLKQDKAQSAAAASAQNAAAARLGGARGRAASGLAGAPVEPQLKGTPSEGAREALASAAQAAALDPATIAGWQQLDDAIAAAAVSAAKGTLSLVEQQNAAIAAYNTENQRVATLGAAATEQEKYNVKVLQLKALLVANKVSQDDYNRAVQAIDPELNLRSLERQQTVNKGITADQKIRLETEKKIADEIDRGTLTETKLQEIYQQEQNQREQINSSVENQTRGIRDQTDLLRVQGTSMEGVVRAAQAYRDAIAAGASATEAAALKAAILEQNMVKAAKAANDEFAAADRASQAEFKSSVSAVGGTFNPTTGSVSSPFGENTSVLASGIQVPTYNIGGRAYADLSGGNWLKYEGWQKGQAESKAASDKALALMLSAPDRQRAGAQAALAAKAGASNLYSEEQRAQFQLQGLQQQFADTTDPYAREALQIEMRDLEASIAKLAQETKDNTDATDKNTDTEKTVLPGLLSSLYKGGQATGLGFGDGGIMTRHGAAGLLPIRLYGDGGIVRTPQIYAAGERYQPEAIIPLKGGGVPVHFTGGGGEASGRGGGPINVMMVANMLGAPPGNLGVGFRQVFGQMANDAGARVVRQMARG